MKNEKAKAQQGRQKSSALKKGHASESTTARSRAASTSEILGRAAQSSSRGLRIPERWGWHYRVLVSLQDRLMRRSGGLLRAASEPLEPHSLDEADSATDEFDHDLALTQLSADQNALHEVNEALKRIQDGTYGLCEETGKAISAARLKAVPWTRFTCEVEERLEKKGVRHQTHVNQAGTVRENGRIRLGLEEESEETAESQAAGPNDEALSHVVSTPGRSISPEKLSNRSPKRS